MYDLTRKEVVLAIEGLRALQRNLTDGPSHLAVGIAAEIGDELDVQYAPAEIAEAIDALCEKLNLGPKPESEAP